MWKELSICCTFQSNSLNFLFREMAAEMVSNKQQRYEVNLDFYLFSKQN